MGSNSSRMVQNPNLSPLFGGFCENMEDIVNKIININLDTKDFCNRLGRSLSVEKRKHYTNHKLWSKVAPGSPPLSEAQMKILMDFPYNEDPFKDLYQEYERLLERYQKLLSNLEEKIKELSEKRETARLCYLVLGNLWSLVKLVAKITYPVVSLVSPHPIAPFVTPVFNLLEELLGKLEKEMGSSSDELKKPGEVEQLVEKIKKYITATRNEIEEITGSVENLSCSRDNIVYHFNNYVGGVLDLAETAMPIKDEEERLLQNLDDLEKEVDRCKNNLTEQIKDLRRDFPLMGKETFADPNAREPPRIQGFPANRKFITLESWIWHRLRGQRLYVRNGYGYFA